MGIQDLVQRHLDQVQAVIDVSAGEVDISSFLHLPRGVKYERRSPTEIAQRQLGEGILLVTAARAEEAHIGSLDSTSAVYGALRSGAMLFMALSWESREFPSHPLLDMFSDLRLQVLQVNTPRYARKHISIIAQCVERILPPRGYTAHSIDTTTSDDADFDIQLRIANEYAFSDFVARSERARSQEIEEKWEEALQEKNEALREKNAAVQEDNAAQALLRETQARLLKTERKVKQLEGSTSFRIGRALVRAAENPRRSIIKLPQQLYHMWRTRRRARASVPSNTPKPASELAAPRQAQPAVAIQESDPSLARLFLKYSRGAITPRNRLVVAGVLQDETAEALRAECDVISMAPHDALAVLERADPDFVLVETAAAEPGTLWTHCGDPAAVERERRLLELIGKAHTMGRPVALWRNSPVHRTTPLDDVALICDLVVDGPGSLRTNSSWHRGVSLGQHVPIAEQGAGRAGVVYVGGWSSQQSLTHHRILSRALRAAGQHGLRIHPEVSAARTDPVPPDLSCYLAPPVHWRDRRRVNASADVAIAAPFSVSESVNGLDTRILAQLAAGVRVVTGPNSELVNALGDHVVTASEQAVEAVVERAAVAGPLDSTARWAALRFLFAEQAAPVMLAHLVERLGLGTDPLKTRSVSVLAHLDGQASVDDLVESVARQRHVPYELIVTVGPAGQFDDRSIAELETIGVAVRTLRSDAGWADLAALARSPWVIAWAGGHWAAERLLDLAIGAECSHAEAIGLVPGEAFEFVSDLPFAGTLVRRDRLASERVVSDSLKSWASQGFALFGVGNGGRTHQTGQTSTGTEN